MIGFAAETEDLIANARPVSSPRSPQTFIVANDVTKVGAGFDVDTNIVTLVGHDGEKALSILSKREVAARLLDESLRPCGWARKDG